MLYPENNKKTLEDSVFQKPGSAYRGAPFWAWNGKLDDRLLAYEIEMLKTMGFGGYHMHVRTGMDSPYLDEEFMGHVRFCNEKGQQLGMYSWLYDEDRWPSGTAGGRVTAENPCFAKQTLLFTPFPYLPSRPNAPHGSEPGRGQRTIRQDNGTLLAVYDICLDDKGYLKSSKLINEEQQAQGMKWYAYIEHAEDDPWFNDHPYVDTLNKKAVSSFISSTHEKYFGSFGREFGRSIPAIFTDEPQFTPKQPLAYAREQKDVFFPWTGEICSAYFEKYGEKIESIIPELVWELPEGYSRARWRFHNLICDLFVDSYCRQIGDWCEKHHIALTGHVNGEGTLLSQTQSVGDAMRCYPPFGIPGIDMLCDFHEYNTAKQCQSIVRQQDKPGMLSELYGVTGWDYDFRGYKLQGDWQAALGVTVRVPHLTWMTMKGEAKRDYPACIGYQSPWWDQYSVIEDHFARLNTVMTRGKASVRTAVIHPIESYWLAWGPSEQTAALRDRLDDQFMELTKILLFGLIDFDFICEANLPEQCPFGGYPLSVGAMSYDTIIVCGCVTLRSTTLDRLEKFSKAGGKLIFIGDCPEYVDAEKNSAVRRLCDSSVRISLNSSAVMKSLESDRFLDVRKENGSRTDKLIYQLREEDNVKWLFVANGVNPVSCDVEDAPKLRFILKGEFICTVYDTLSGGIKRMPCRYEDGRTIFFRKWYMHDSLLIKLEPGRLEGFEEEQVTVKAPAAIMGLVDIHLSEPNMLLLDMAQYALDDGEMQPEEELLRIDNHARKALGIPLRRKEIVQPYLLNDEIPAHSIKLRFTIPSEYDSTGSSLAMEEPENAVIVWNGTLVPPNPNGWFVDKDIKKVPLPPILTGINILEVTVPVGSRTNLEYMYLLGDFGVKINGTVKTIIAPVRQIGFGDIVSQGLPFYTGNIEYCFTVETMGDFSIRVPSYRGGLIKVFVDDQDKGNIIFSPYIAEIKGLPAGKHSVRLKLFGVRQNGFGQLHHTQGVYFYQSPNSWRSEGDLWHYEYSFKPFGILKSPEIRGAGNDRKTIVIIEAS